MIDQLLKQLNGYEVLQKNLQTYIEAFVEYYGEEKRSIIEERLSKAFPIAYIPPENINNYLIEIEKEKTKELLTKLLEEKNLSLTYEDLFAKVTLKYPDQQPFDKYLKFYQEYQKGREKRIEEFHQEGFRFLKEYLKELTYEEFLEILKSNKFPEQYSYLPEWIQKNTMYYAKEKNADAIYKRLYTAAEPILKKVIPEITFQTVELYEENGKLNELNSLCEEYIIAKKEYVEFTNGLTEYYEKKRLIDEHKERLQDKYYKKLLQEFIQLIPPEKRTNIEDYLNGKKPSSMLDSYVKLILGSNMTTASLLEAFSKESEEKLNNSEEISWIRKNIMDDRIRYFQKNGIYLGVDYETYFQSKEAQAIWPNRELVTKFLERKKELENEYYNEFYTTLPLHQKIRAEIDSLGLLNKNDSFNARLYNAKTTAINPNVRRTPSGYELYSLLLVCLDTRNTGCIDHNIVHELNHLYELSLEMAGERSYTVLCGWDSFTDEITQKEEIVDTMNDDDSKRDYELLSEIINELIAQDICKIMHKNHSFVLDTENNSRYKRTTDYENSFFLVREFFEENKQEIIESRSNGNISLIWETVGKENFDELNELFHIFYENFGGLKYYKLMDEIYDNKDTERTRIYHKILARKEEVLEKMRMHKETQKKANYDK